MTTDDIQKHPIVEQFFREHPRFYLRCGHEIMHEACPEALATMWVNLNTNTIMFKQTFSKFIIKPKILKPSPILPNNIVPLSTQALNHLYSSFYEAYNNFQLELKRYITKVKLRKINNDFNG